MIKVNQKNDAQSDDLLMQLGHLRKINAELKLLLDQNEQSNYELENLLKEYEKKISNLEKKIDQNQIDLDALNKKTILQKCEIDDQCEQINILKIEKNKLRKKNVIFLIKSITSIQLDYLFHYF